MVSAVTIVLVLILGIFFFSKGGIEKAKELAKGVLPRAFAEETSEEVNVDTLQSDLSTVPIREGSKGAVARIQESQIDRTDVRQKRKFNPLIGKPNVKTVFDNPFSGGTRAQRGTTNFSSGQSFSLSESELTQLRSKSFTAQEKRDLEALKLRNTRKIARGTDPRLIQSPEKIIMTKREQALVSRKQIESKFGAGAFVQVGGATTASGASLGITAQAKLFAKPNFEFGGVSRATFEAQQTAKTAQRARIQENQARAAAQTERGREIARVSGLSKQSQKIFLASKGINLQGGALTQRALGRLAEQGLI